MKNINEELLQHRLEQEKKAEESKDMRRLIIFCITLLVLGFIGMPLSKLLISWSFIKTWRAVKFIMLGWAAFSFFVAYKAAKAVD